MGVVELVAECRPRICDGRQPGCPEEKVKAIEEALKHFKMI